MSEYDLIGHAMYSQLTDQQLDEVVRDIQSHFPTCSNRQMQGHLLSRGIRVQQQRITAAHSSNWFNNAQVENH